MMQACNPPPSPAIHPLFKNEKRAAACGTPIIRQNDGPAEALNEGTRAAVTFYRGRQGQHRSAGPHAPQAQCGSPEED
jgi:hypothetical protein